MSTSPTTPTGTMPANAEALWALAIYFCLNWKENCNVSSAFATQHDVAISAAEQRFGYSGKPIRTIKQTITARGRQQCRLIRMLAQRAAIARSLVPISSDQSELTATVLSGATFLPCDTSKRRIFAGMRVAVLAQDGDPFQPFFNVAEVSSVTPTGINLASGLSQNFNPGSLVVPLIEAQVKFKAEGQVLTDEVATLEVTGLETPGKTQLPSVVSLNSIPSGFDSFRGLPILSTPINYGSDISFGVERYGSTTRSGLDSIPDPQGARGRNWFDLPFLCNDRSKAWGLISFFESRGGMLYPFWVPSPLTEHTATSVYGGSSGLGLTVTASPGYEPTLDWSLRPYMAVVLKDGTTYIREVTFFGRVGGIDTVIFDTPIAGLGLSNIDRVTTALLVKMNSDELTEEWLTDSKMQCTIPVIEVLNEKDITIPNIPDVHPIDQTTPVEVCTECEAAATVPMFSQPCNSCDPNRTIFPAAPLAIGPDLRLSFASGQISKDSLHSHAGSLSNLIALLGSRTWLLSYAGTSAVRPDSRHPHHAFVTGGSPSWTHDIPDVTKHVWTISQTYTGNDAQTRTLVIRFVAEFVSNPADVGANGTLFTVYVFSDEINPTYVDGTLLSGIRYYRDDPFVYDAGAKKCHPQLALVATIPTSMQSPCGYEYTPPLERENTSCFALSVGTPWSSAPSSIEAISNSVYYNGSTSSGCTLGGDCPTSRLFPHLTIENAPGSGMTALKPLNSGWDNALGGLIYSPAPSMTLTPSCVPAAPDYSCCEDIDDPEAVPGSDCIRFPDIDQGGMNGCCFAVDATLLVDLVRVCVSHTTTELDEDCNLTGESELSTAIVATYTKTIEMELDSCNTPPWIDSTARNMVWGYREPDPAHVDRSTTDDFDDGTVTDWTIGTGTFVESGGFLSNSVQGAGLYKTLLLRSGPESGMSSLKDTSGSVEVWDVTRPAGVVVRKDPFTNNGYVIQYVPDNGSGEPEVAIWEVIGATATKVASKTFVQMGVKLEPGMKINWTVQGDTISGGVDSSLFSYQNATLCTTIQQGYCGIGTLNAAGTPGQQYDNFVLSDDSPSLLTATVTHSGTGGWSFTIPMAMFPGAAACAAAASPCVLGAGGTGISTSIHPPGTSGNLVGQQQEPDSPIVLPTPYLMQRPGANTPSIYQMPACEEVGPEGVFAAVHVVVSGQCNSNIPESYCNGFSWYHGSCALSGE